MCQVTKNATFSENYSEVIARDVTNPKNSTVETKMMPMSCALSVLKYAVNFTFCVAHHSEI